MRHSSRLIGQGYLLAIAFIVALLLVAAPSQGQSLAAPTEQKEVAATDLPDPYRRETPRAAVTGLLDALASNDFERAAHYFPGVPDAPIVPKRDAADASVDQPLEVDKEAAESATRDYTETMGAAADLARKLKLILDRGGTLTPYAGLSTSPTGTIADGLEPSAEKVGSFGEAAPDTSILLTRLVPGDGNPQWRVAPETADLIASIVLAEPEKKTDGSIEKKPISVAGAPLVDWAKLLAIAVGAFLLFWLAARAILAVLRKLLADPEANAVYRVLYAGLPPLALYLSVLTFYLTANDLQVAIVARQTLLRYAGIVGWVALAWFVLRLIDGVAKIATARMHRAERRQAVSIANFIRRGAKFLVLAVAAIAVFDTIGLDVTTGIAALGIGGLALALGAQKTIENLVGSLTVIADKPVQVGDVAKIGDVYGTVEDIGMRSTRVRTNERTVVTIPNGDLAAQRIENFALRDRFLFNQTLGVSYDTSAGQMEKVLEAIRDIIGASDNIIDEDARVRFHGFGDSSLDIEMFCYFRTRSYPSALAMQEELLFAIMRKLDELNVEIAFPTRTVNLRAEPPNS